MLTLDVAVLGFESADIERRRHLVGSLDVDSGRGGAGGALSEVLCDGGLCAPFVVAEDAEVAFHILDYENIVGVVDVGSGGGDYGPAVREYVRALGEINAALARRASHVYELMCGIPLVLKGELLK